MDYEAMNVEDAFWLIAARRPDAISELEEKTGLSQTDMVDTFIEDTCWGADIPQFRGNLGIAKERIAALRALLTGIAGHPELAAAMREPN